MYILRGGSAKDSATTSYASKYLKYIYIYTIIIGFPKHIGILCKEFRYPHMSLSCLRSHRELKNNSLCHDLMGNNIS